MRTLTNDYHDCEVLDLGFNPSGRGPFIIRQEGIPPGMVAREGDRFLLHPDGRWVINFAVFALPEDEQKAFLYDDIPAVMAVLGKLVGKPQVEDALPPDMSRAQLQAAMESAHARVWARMREVRGTKLPG